MQKERRSVDRLFFVIFDNVKMDAQMNKYTQKRIKTAKNNVKYSGWAGGIGDHRVNTV